MSIWSEPLCRFFRRNTAAPRKPGEFRCPLCGLVLPLATIRAHAVADDQLFAAGRLIARIKQDHPDWVETDGACPKCIEYYRSVQAGTPIRIQPRPWRSD